MVIKIGVKVQAYREKSESDLEGRTEASIEMNSNPVRIAVDVVPLLPGGENGGAKLLTIELIKHLSRLAADWEFVLLTSERSHEELAFLDSPNVQRVCVLRQGEASAAPIARITRWENWTRNKLEKILPVPVMAMLGSAFKRVVHGIDQGRSLKGIQADLLFCPFTAPFSYDPRVPLVSVIYDLQYHYYPQFFSPEDRRCRDKNFRETCRLADRLICISEYVRETVLELSNLNPQRVVSIPIQLPNRLHKPLSESITPLLERYHLKEEEFLLYPANFWPHKNHQMLFTAFGMYCARHPHSHLTLVCTGALDEQKGALEQAVRRMGLQGRIFLPGFVSDEEFAAILVSCLALVFPSLYEGFGMPILEAMAFGKPVICSNVTSLPEVAGDAAIFIDPRKPLDIVHAIEQITSDATIIKDLIDQGYQRLTAFGGPEKMARQYLDIFLELMRKG